MADSDKRGHAPIVISAAVLLLPVAYLLAIGPVFRLVKDGKIPDACAYIYLPIVWLCDRSEVIGRVVRWYLSLYGC